MYCVFHHISSHLPRQIWFWKISTKTWASVRPPPLVGPKAQVFPKNYFDGTPQALINQTLTRLRRKEAATNRLDADVLRTEADHACLQVKTTILAILS